MARLPEQIETPRLVLRRWTVRDTAALHEAVTANVEHLAGFLHWAQFEPVSLEDRQALIEGWEDSWKQGGDTHYGAWVPDSTELVGAVGLISRDGDRRTLEIGYWIDQNQVRRGYAREIASAATTAAFAMPGVETVEIFHDQANIASEGIPRTLGIQLQQDYVAGPNRPGPGLQDSGVECRWSVTKDRWAQPCMA